MKCPRCQQENPPQAKFCLQCGTPVHQENGPAAASYADLQHALSESLDRQTATSEILRTISQAHLDVQPVFEAIADSAMRLLGAWATAVGRYDGELFSMVSARGGSPGSGDAAKERLESPHRPTDPPELPVLTKTVHHVVDVETDPSCSLEFRRHAVARGFRSFVAVPMLRGDEPLGIIAVSRAEAGGFSAAEIALLQTFADQAVIAIENVRLFTELQEKNRGLTDAYEQVSEALEQQTATTEILSVISRSPGDIQPVFDAIVRSAVRLCDGLLGTVLRVDGNRLELMAHFNVGREGVQAYHEHYPMPIGRETVAGNAILDRRVIHVIDAQDDGTVPPRSVAMARAAGFRGVVAVPLLRDGAPIGLINVARRDPGPFSDRQITVIQIFANQAVLAIENVRLFTELRERTAQLGRSVDELTALAQVSEALSSTLDIETVLTTTVSRAIELSGADGGSVYEYDDAAEEFRLRATKNFEEELVQASRAMPLRRGEGALGLITERRRPIQIADISDPAIYQSRVRDVLLRTGYRAILAVPLLRDDRVLGALVIGRKAAGEFAPGVMRLLTTFANQSALAMQNARFFRELAGKSRQLEVASQHKSEFLANMSHELRTPLNAVIGFSEVLRDRMFGDLNEKQDEYLNDIHASGQHLLSLINDILDLSKIEAGRMELELSDLNLPATLDNALTLVRERAGRHAIALNLDVDEQVDSIRADERKIRQVVLNLLSNAIKFTPDGGRIDVRAVTSDDCVEVSVSDTGVGIAPEDQEAIFEEFRQVGTAAKKVEGTGLGLALSRKFVELHGGRIWVQSRVGDGSTFRFTIPVSRGE